MSNLWLPPQKPEAPVPEVKTAKRIRTFVYPVHPGDSNSVGDVADNMEYRGATVVAMLTVPDYGMFGDRIGYRPVIIYQHTEEFDYEETC